MPSSSTSGLDVLVVDDEPHALRNLEYLLLREPGIGNVQLCDSGADAARLIQEHPPDLVFLDVQMPEVGGFEVIRRVSPARMPPVVFVTAHDAFALRAFEIHAVDYLLKPVSDERFRLALQRARSRRAATEAVALSQRLAGLLAGPELPAAPTRSASSRLVIRDGGRSLVFEPEEIDWIEAQDYCINIVTGSTRHLVRMTLSAVEAELDASVFVRVHRSAIVNVKRVRQIRSESNGRVMLELRNGEKIPVSRGRLQSLQTLLQGTS